MKQHSPDQAHTGKTEGGKSLDPRLTTLEDDGEVVHSRLDWGQPLTTASLLLHGDKIAASRGCPRSRIPSSLRKHVLHIVFNI